MAPGLRFCNACGGALGEPPGGTAESPGVEAAAPSERRLVSVLFVDLEGFTALAEAMDPEDVRHLQSVYFEATRSVIARYGGSIEKFIGDAVMAVWGAPIAHGDDGQRAVLAALEIVAAVGKLRGAAAGRRLVARAAVATGEVAVTIGVQGQGMVAGDLVNTAARLQTVAPPNGVLVDTTTRRVVGDAVSFERAGRVDLRGKAEALEAWRATDVPASGGRGRAAGHGGTFVGRSRELAELVELHRRTVASRRSRLVSVIGIAGIGKSRLVWEFERHLDLLPEPLALHIGRVPAYGEGITFAPLAEMVRRRARIAEGTDSEVARRQLAATLEELIPDEAERQWVEPRLATLLEPGEHASFERDELFAAWRRFFEGVAAWAPALLIFEDLQWADGALLDFIDHLALWSRDHPILVVTLARPEFLDRRPNWGTGLPSFTSIQLEPLDDVAMAELLVGLAPGLAPEDVSRIAATSGGVPLYGVEVVRMLLDRGLAHLEEGTLMLLEPLDGVRIPETLQSLVSARIDAIPRQERGLLLSASVLGRRFHPDALAAISRLRPDEARQRIIALSRRELLAVDDDLRSPGRGQLSFVQDVVREVAYRTLSRRERRTLHVAAADHLDSLRDDELVEAVAEHLVDAHQAAPEHPEAAQVAARAVDALRRAAARAMTLHVPERALTHLRRALDLVDDDGTRAELWGEASAAARAVPDFEAAEKLLRRLIAWHDESGAPEAAARARAGLASLLLATERHASAIGDLEAALAGIADLPADTASVELIGQLARARVLVGQDRQGLEWADRALALARTSGLDAIAVDALVTRGTARMRLGEETSGSTDLREAIREADRLGLVGAGLRARNNLAWLVVLDDPHMTLETARVGFEVATRMGVGDMALQLASIVVAVAIDTGEWMAAQSMLDEMRERPQAPAHRIQFVATDAMLRAMQGDITAAALLEALEPVDPDTDAQIVAAIDEASAWIAFAQGRFDDARRCAEAAASGSLGAEQHRAHVLATRASLWLADHGAVVSGLERLTRLGTRGRTVMADLRTLQAGAAALAGDPAAAAGYAGSVAAWRALRLPLHLALCQADRYRSMPDGDPGRAGALAEVEAILDDLGAVGLLEALRADGPRKAVHRVEGQFDDTSSA